MLYKYRARDVDGEVQSGTLHADSTDDVALKLRTKGLTAISIDESDQLDASLGIFSRRVRREEVLYVTNQMAIMVETGIPLSTALQGIIDQEENPSLRRVLKEIMAAVESGETLSAALAAHPRLFDTRYVALVRAAESTGTLGEMLYRIGNYLRKEIETRSKIRSAMAYPCVMAVLAVLVSVFLLMFILPKFTPLFQRKGFELPGPTKFVLALSDGLTDYWFLWLLAAILVPVGLIFARRHDLGRRVLDWAQLHMPILGPMQQKVVISRGIRTLGALLGGGVPMLDALRLCSAVAGNFYYRRLWESAMDEVTGGSQLSRALQASPLLPRTLVHMIHSGEEAGRLPEVLERVSDYYDHEVDSAVKSATTLIEPLMICVMGVVVGTIGLALLLPIFKLSQPG